MKVLQVNKLYYPHTGGIENVVRDLALGLNDKVRLEVLVANERLKTETAILEGVKVTRVASFGRLQSAPIVPTFPLWLRKKRADIYHFHSPFPTGELSYLMARPKGKLVLTYHSDIIRQKKLLKLYGPFLRSFLRKVDVVIAASPQMIENSPFLAPVAYKCRVIPYGIDVDKFALTSPVTDKIAGLKHRHGERSVLFVGRLIYYKGIEYLIEAMAKVNANLVIVGTGPLEMKMRELAQTLGVARRVDFVGAVSDEELAAYYHACKLLVLPSIEPSEAFGLVQLEAHVCGKPVVSTALPTGVQFANQDRVTGLVVPPRDVEALAQAINRILDDPVLYEKYSRQAKERVMREFTKERMIERVYALYEELVDGSRLTVY